ncbi:MAG: hypothetical protein QM638_09420 [Nocardioides sp.]|uniref:O-antigen ligase family protein n=1 Tax=Nocardioides sp. TaxID=35761 RepID=UPI0039E4CECA
MSPSAKSYPMWPLVAYLALTPVWWLLGVIDLVLLPLGLVMALYLVAGGRVRGPRGFGLWVLFLVWMLASVVMVDTANHMVAFVYRAGIYLASTAVFLYIYNHSDQRIGRRVAGLLTATWAWVVVGGFLGALLPNTVIRTPAFWLLRTFAGGLASNDFINHMVVRRLAQYNPDSYLGVAARPSAPFLYANNWGNVYSLLLPMVIVYLLILRRGEHRRDRALFWVLGILVTVSIVPAAFTMNRGMLIGIGVVALYLALRLATRGHIMAMVAIVVVTLAGAVVFQHLAGDRLETRLEGSGTSTRASLYTQSLELVPHSPIFGYGVPPTSQDVDAPPVGTQGQFWMVLVSNGPVATVAFVGFFLMVWWRSRRRRDGLGQVACAVSLAGVVELGFYGVVPYGLPIMMATAAVALRRPDARPRPIAVAPTRAVLHWPARAVGAPVTAEHGEPSTVTHGRSSAQAPSQSSTVGLNR